MQSIKTMSEELNDRFLANAGKIIIALGLVVLLYSFCSFCIESLYIILVRLFPKSYTAIFTIAFIFAVLSMFFVLHYGTMVLIARLERNKPSSIGYLFLGFRHTRTSGAVWIFSGLLFICLSLSSLPLILNIDFSTMESIENFLTNGKMIDIEVFGKSFSVPLLSLCLQCGVFVFLICFCILFYMFSFVWIIIYDLPEVSAMKACIRSFKMVKAHFFHFFGYLVFVNRKNIFIILGVDLLKIVLYYFDSQLLKSAAGFLLSFIGFVAALMFAAKLSIAIPFYYDKINESSDK